MDESIAVTPSVEEIPEATPSEPAEPVAPAEPTEPVLPTEPEAELFELPDGRKVDAPTLTKEWKENFLPDYTRKSQTLAEIEKSKLPTTETVNKYEDPKYVPQSFEEILKVAEERAVKAIEAKEQSRIDAHQALETEVDTQLSDVKKLDPTVNENALFLHATKYGFRDLKLAYQNMKDMSATIKQVQTKTAQDIAKRNDPVSISPGANGSAPNPSNFSSARDYLRSLK